MGTTDRRPVTKAMAIIRRPHDGAILVGANVDADGRLFERPLGGHVEHGEVATEAIRREIREEIDQELAEVRLIEVLENHFTLDGRSGHEVVFMFDAVFADSAAYEIETQPNLDDADAELVVRWRHPDVREPPLVPAGIDRLVAEDAWRASLPRKRVGAGALIRNKRGEILLVEPTYKPVWEMPGGLVEAGESPSRAARRECREELGVEVEIGRVLSIQYSPGRVSPEDDGVMFVFDGGITTRSADEFDLPAHELRSARFVDREDLADYVWTGLVSRIERALDAIDSGTLDYSERGLA